MYGLSCRLSLWWQLVRSSLAPRLVLSRARELSPIEWVRQWGESAVWAHTHPTHVWGITLAFFDACQKGWRTSFENVDAKVKSLFGVHLVSCFGNERETKADLLRNTPQTLKERFRDTVGWIHLEWSQLIKSQLAAARAAWVSSCVCADLWHGHKVLFFPFGWESEKPTLKMFHYSLLWGLRDFHICSVPTRTHLRLSVFLVKNCKSQCVDAFSEWRV